MSPLPTHVSGGLGSTGPPPFQWQTGGVESWASPGSDLHQTQVGHSAPDAEDTCCLSHREANHNSSESRPSRGALAKAEVGLIQSTPNWRRQAALQAWARLHL